MAKDIAVVTGASGGIGRAVAHKIHQASGGDLRLALHYNGNRAAASAVQAEIPDSFLIGADISKADGRKALLDAVLKEGFPYALVNNAGIDKPHEPALMIEERSFDAIIGVNLKAPLFLMKEFARAMAQEGAGVVVNVSSVLARKSLVGSALYRASKAALEQVTRQFAYGLGPRGVRVNAVVPGFIETPMTEAIASEIKDRIKGEIAVGRFGGAEAVAEAVWQLIENDYINGALLPVDGGMAL